MISMPTLSTGAVQQYPYVGASAGQTRRFVFANGSEQRYLAVTPRRTWSINLHQIGELERDSFLEFAQNTLRTQATFQFTDPFDGMTYPTCRIATAPVADRVDGVDRAGVQFLISEAQA